MIVSKKEQCKEIARLMREGSTKTLPLKDAFYARSKYAEYACALGAVLYAQNKINCIDRLSTLREEFPVLSQALMWGIINKNTAGVPREFIADWLEGLEWDD